MQRPYPYQSQYWVVKGFDREKQDYIYRVARYRSDAERLQSIWALDPEMSEVKRFHVAPEFVYEDENGLHFDEYEYGKFLNYFENM